MPARQLRLIGSAAMLYAIRETGVYLLAAKVEIGLAGVAHGPAADTLGKIEQAGFVSHLGAGLGGHQTARRGRRNGCLLVARALAQEAAGAN